MGTKLGDVSGQVQENLTVALDESVGELAYYLGEAIHKADDSMTQRWEQWQVTLSENARQLAGSQSRLADHTQQIQEVIQQIPEMTSQIAEVQETLMARQLDEPAQQNQMQPESIVAEETQILKFEATPPVPEVVEEVQKKQVQPRREIHLPPVIIPFSSAEKAVEDTQPTSIPEPDSENLPLVILPMVYEETNATVASESTSSDPNAPITFRKNAA